MTPSFRGCADSPGVIPKSRGMDQLWGALLAGPELSQAGGSTSSGLTPSPSPHSRFPPNHGNEEDTFSLKPKPQTKSCTTKPEIHSLQIPAFWTPGAPNHPCTCTGVLMDTVVTMLFFCSRKPAQVKSSRIWKEGGEGKRRRL